MAALVIIVLLYSKVYWHKVCLHMFAKDSNECL